MVIVTVCVGSSCHLKGAREMVVRFSELLAEHGLGEKVVLKGSFCMERCTKGINWQIDGQPVTSASREEAEKTFQQRVVAPLGAGGEATRPGGARP